ncbi:MAG: 30S ribosomal protein S6 [Planctomycetales bacterium]|nr:30S ribosomal protein S6 [Planctomycetales bacterium]
MHPPPAVVWVLEIHEEVCCSTAVLGDSALARNVYECMFIFDSNRYARDAGAIAKLASDLIEAQGGEVLASRLWNEQRLAYPIDGHRKGTYWLTYFSMESSGLKDMARQCEINDDVLRHLVLKVDTRLVDTLVAVARGEALPAPSGADADGEEESADAEAAAN